MEFKVVSQQIPIISQQTRKTVSGTIITVSTNKNQNQKNWTLIFLQLEIDHDKMLLSCFMLTELDLPAYFHP